MGKSEIVAMILAGGQGSRLGVLTKKLAKPAVPFGGKYRIIDFPLSNCSNSGIYTVGVLTQYKPLELNAHIGIGSPWDLDRRDAGVRILPPYQEEKGGNWYKGTANAIYQNTEFIDSYNPEYVSIDEASRFGIMNTREDHSIYEFEEKPKVPKSTLASMGIYIFNWKTLKKYLREDELDRFSSNDFGKNIIPKMIKDNLKMMAYPFEGYWKDVGTIQSLWEANMDLLDEDNKLNLYDKEWKIYSSNQVSIAQYIGEEALIKNSLIVEGCTVYGNVEDSVLFQGVKIGKKAIIKDSVIMPNASIGDNVIIEKAIIGSDAIIRKGCRIGDGNEIAVIASSEEVKSGSLVEACSTI